MPSAKGRKKMNIYIVLASEGPGQVDQNFLTNESSVLQLLKS